MSLKSVWFDPKNENKYPSLQGNLNVDVAIIGGGICGITAASILSEKGLNVAVLEASKIAESNTGMSTGNLYCMVDSFLSDLSEKYEFNVLHQILNSRLLALSYIEDTINRFQLLCDFKRVPWYRFSAHSDMDEKIKKEFEILKKMDIPAFWMDKTHETLKVFQGRNGIRVDNQAQFNPYQYVVGLGQSIQNKCKIFENTRVVDINEKDHSFEVKTTSGMVFAKHVIEATHTPLGFSVLQTLLGPYREYGIASEHEKSFEDGIYWGYYEKDQATSVRNFKKDGTNYLLTIGAPNKVGQADSNEGINKLKQHTNKYFQTSEPSYRWAGQHYRPADNLPYIGRKNDSNLYVATGFSTDGLIYGTVAAQIISDEILKIHNPYAQIYSSHRIQPVKSFPKFIKENANVAKQYIRDYLKSESLHKLEKGEGTVVDIKGKKIATCRNMEGDVLTMSAVCPHLGCIVHWNKGEQSWDCPCHGSRFDEKGHVLEGPAMSDLE